MKKLKAEILNTVSNLKEVEDFITKKTSEDPTTSKTTWVVEYQPNLKKLYSEIDNVVKKLEKLQKRVQSSESESLLKLSKTLRNRFSRLLKKYNTIKEQSSTSQGGASFTPGSGAQYATPKAFSKKKNKETTYYHKMGYKTVPKKIKGSGLEVKKLYENEAKDFQQERINIFDLIEKELNDLSPMISNAKNSTIEYYNQNPGSYAIVRSTDLILDYIKDIKQLLKGEEE